MSIVTFRWPLIINLKLKWFHLHKQLLRLNLIIKSLTYNYYLSWSYIVDIILEPILWFVENFTSILGPIFVLLVSIVTALIVYISYYVGLPWWWNKSPEFTIILLIVGNWLLLQVLFNYYMGINVAAGYPPVGGLIPEAVSICKKCMKPKPPRTHHCSICNMCVLKMDHHCPWLNNCVGFYNHRYFFQYMAFTIVGLLFIIIFGFQIAYEEFILNSEPEPNGHPVQIKNSEIIPLTESLEHLNKDEQEKILKEIEERKENEYRRKLIILAALICVATLCALSGLTWWHSGLISRGETSIENRINCSLEKKYNSEGKIYKNPYDYGKKENWNIFLGLKTRKWWYLLIPSTHKPYGNGFIWNTIKPEKAF